VFNFPHRIPSAVHFPNSEASVCVQRRSLQCGWEYLSCCVSWGVFPLHAQVAWVVYLQLNSAIQDEVNAHCTVGNLSRLIKVWCPDAASSQCSSLVVVGTGGHNFRTEKGSRNAQRGAEGFQSDCISLGVEPCCCRGICA
jgi:hypothetical protein